MQHPATHPLTARSLPLLLCILVAGGCGDNTHPAPDPPPEQTSATTPESPKNLLMLVLDTTTARRWPIYGHPRETTPFVRSLADDAVVFERAYSQATTTITSVWSYFMGRYGYLPEGERKLVRVRKGVDIPLAQHFREAGFATGGFSENTWISAMTGLNAGFDRFENPGARVKKVEGGFERDETASRETLAGASDFLRSIGDQKFFCYVHFLRPHNWYVSPEPFLGRFYQPEVPEGASLTEVAKSREGVASAAYLRNEPLSAEQARDLESLYDGNVAYSDHLIAEVFKVLEEEDLLEETLVVIMSDHGEAFGEHGKFWHTSEPYEELIHVPLVIRAPRRAGFVHGVIKTPVELVDLAPTLRDLFGLKIDQPLDGKSLVPLLRGGDRERRTETSISQNLKTRTVSVRHGASKLILRLDPEFKEVVAYELYDLEVDPGEKNDLFESTEGIDELMRIATAYLASRGTGEGLSVSEMPDDQTEELKALGYLR